MIAYVHPNHKRIDSRRRPVRIKRSCLVPLFEPEDALVCKHWHAQTTLIKRAKQRRVKSEPDGGRLESSHRKERHYDTGNRISSADQLIAASRRTATWRHGRPVPHWERRDSVSQAELDARHATVTRTHARWPTTSQTVRSKFNTI